MNFVVSGKVIKVLPVVEGTSQSGTNWARQTVVLEHESGQYPKTIAFDVNGKERIANMQFAEGQEVTVNLNVNAREFNGKIFNSIDCWKVEHTSQGNPPAPAAQGIIPPAQPGEVPF